MELEPNPDVETLKMVLWIACGVISILLAVLAYFLKEQITVSKTLTNAVNNLTNAVTVLEIQQKERDPIYERRLNEHAKRLDVHEIQITRIETTLKI